MQEEEEEEAEASPQETVDEGVQSSQPTQSKQKVKQGSKKKRQQVAAASQQRNRQDSTDIDAVIQELKPILDSEMRQAEQQAAAALEPQEAPLTLQPKMLNPDEELRRMFGSAVINLEQTERQHGRQQGRNPASRPRGWKPAQSRPKLLSRPANMPAADGLLSMQCLGANYPMHGGYISMLPTPRCSSPATLPPQHTCSRAGANGGPCTQFQLTASAAYRTTSMHFKQAQASMDPNNIAAVLTAHPNNIECLLAMCDLYNSTGQVRDASRAFTLRRSHATSSSLLHRRALCMGLRLLKSMHILKVIAVA